MRFVVGLVCVVLAASASSPSLAQAEGPAPLQRTATRREAINPEVLRLLDQRIDSARATRGWGMGITIVGAVFSATGASILAWAAEKSFSSSSSRSSAIAGGASVLGVGTAALAIGIPLWVSGSRRVGKYEDDKIKILLSVQSAAPGLAVSTRF